MVVNYASKWKTLIQKQVTLNQCFWENCESNSRGLTTQIILFVGIVWIIAVTHLVASFTCTPLIWVRVPPRKSGCRQSGGEFPPAWFSAFCTLAPGRPNQALVEGSLVTSQFGSLVTSCFLSSRNAELSSFSESRVTPNP